MAMRTVERFAEGVNRLYEQGAEEGRIGEYVRRWWGWVRGGLDFRPPQMGGEVSQLENRKKLLPNFSFQFSIPLRNHVGSSRPPPGPSRWSRDWKLAAAPKHPATTGPVPVGP